jgi:hypothetical protein
MAERARNFSARLDALFLAHPWWFASIGALGLSVLLFPLHVPLLVTLSMCVVYFGAAGWSASRGPDRKMLERRIQRRDSLKRDP